MLSGAIPSTWALALAFSFLHEHQTKRLMKQEGWLPPTKRASAAKIN